MGSPEKQDSQSATNYFRAVEETFIRLRGAPLLLSPADWQVVRRWHAEEIPLTLVLGALERLFTQRAERGQSTRRVQSLRYFASAVEEAWEIQRELTAGGERGTEAAAIDIGARLRALADSLPPDLERRDDWRERIEGLPPDSAEAVERGLAELDSELLEWALASLPAGELQALRSTVAAKLETSGRALSPDALRHGAERLLRQAVRRRLELPVLSLFSPEAE